MIMSESSPSSGFVFLILTKNSNSGVLKDWNPLNPKYPSCLSTLITCLSRYTEQDGMVDQVFPPIGKDGFDPDFRIQVLQKSSALIKSIQFPCRASPCQAEVTWPASFQEFSTFGFWKEGLPEIDLEDLADIIPQNQEDAKDLKT